MGATQYAVMRIVCCYYATMHTYDIREVGEAPRQALPYTMAKTTPNVKATHRTNAKRERG